jgi:hypothetical protein
MLEKCFRRKTIWWPTWSGWCIHLFPPLLLLAAFLASAESFLSITKRVPADTLLVEGWMGIDPLEDAKREFEQGGYARIVVTGALSGQPWSKERWSLTERAERELLRLGLPKEVIFLCPCKEVEKNRTYESAAAALRALEAKGIRPAGINVISRGAHARRTRSVYVKVFGSNAKIGIISWQPYASDGKAWWSSSMRAKELLSETVGYAYEFVLDSGRSRVKLAAFAAVMFGLSVAIFVVARGSQSGPRETEFPGVTLPDGARENGQS